jgi:hypothetical protein
VTAVGSNRGLVVVVLLLLLFLGLVPARVVVRVILLALLAGVVQLVEP